MRNTDFQINIDTTMDRVRVHGDYLYHGMRFEFTLNEQRYSPRGNKEPTARRKYRGQITVISPQTGRPMEFAVKHPFAADKAKQTTAVKHREISANSRSPKLVKEVVRKAAQAIYADNALMFSRLVKNTIHPDTIGPELAGYLYAEEYIKSRYGKRNAEDTLKKKLNKLVDAIAQLPYKPMYEISTAEANKALESRPKDDRSLVSDFWDYCILKHYCSGKNPVTVPVSGSMSAGTKQKRLQVLTRVPKQNLEKLNKILHSEPSGPNCGVALLESCVSAQAACGLLWKDVYWPTADPSYAIGRFERPDVMCAVHNYSRPLLPITALLLYARRQALSQQFSSDELAEMHIVSTKSDPRKPMQPAALVQESKRLLLQSGIDQNKLLRAKESRRDPVSARILAETYKDLLLRPCGVEDGSGTQKFLCGAVINNDVTSANYVSFTDPVGAKRLWKYLRPTAPRQIYDKTLQLESGDGYDVFRVRPATSELCAGVLVDIILQPGQAIELNSESGLSGIAIADSPVP